MVEIQGEDELGLRLSVNKREVEGKSGEGREMSVTDFTGLYGVTPKETVIFIVTAENLKSHEKLRMSP
jgi:hypothetical protein